MQPVMFFEELDSTSSPIAGGKGAHLGALSRIEGVRVPAGFCVTTSVFDRIFAAATVEALVEQLSRARPEDRREIAAVSQAVRAAVEAVAFPDDLAHAIHLAVARLGGGPFAVRSSATAEDTPTASFAGQHDSFLGVDAARVVQHVGKCFASLFSERAVVYRLKSGIDARSVRMAVVVQHLLRPRAAGVLFTADPVSGNRRVSTIEAGFGLADALVAGLVDAEVYEVRDGAVTQRASGRKLPTTAREPRPATATGGERRALRDEEVVRLARLGRRIEAGLGRPQDIEWCLVEDDFHVVQSRPITTLFPIPPASSPGNRVYLSVGHQQMMTDPMKPLGLSFWKLIAAGRPMVDAGGRVFVDVTTMLATTAGRAAILELIGKSDPRMGDAVQSVLQRGDFVATLPDDTPGGGPPIAPTALVDADPAIPAAVVARAEAALATLKRDIQGKSGAALLDFIDTDIEETKRVLYAGQTMPLIVTVMRATWWLNEHLDAWLGEKDAADVLVQSAPNNVTAEMGLALLDVADVARSFPAVIAFLERGPHDASLAELEDIAGGRETHRALRRWLDRYGVRGPGEIDITRPRFHERPAMLLPTLLAHCRAFAPGEAGRRFARGREEAARAEREILARLHALPDGRQKADETKRMIDRLRAFAGFREYPKYAMVSRTFVYKQALLEESARLVERGVFASPDDVFFLSFDELSAAVRFGAVNRTLFFARRAEFDSFRALTPPRVLTSDGECLSGSYRREDAPAGALVGLAVSAGTVEGRARVVLDIAEAALEPGDILVTAFTDPSWTPLFVGITALVTEVGGRMTHGAVIAREYGLPAVVGVENATRLIRDGEWIRVNGSDGYVELLRTSP